jgi:hypothetical protein
MRRRLTIALSWWCAGAGAGLLVYAILLRVAAGWRDPAHRVA